MTFVKHVLLAACGLVMLYCTSLYAADPANARRAPTCAHNQGVRIADIPGCSLYRHYREAILDPSLPTQLHLPDNSERSWIITVLGLTLFSEARMENEQSVAAAAASVMNRAGFGTRTYSIDRIALAAANSDYSQWLVTSQLLAQGTSPWVTQSLKSDNHLTKTRLESENEANIKVLKDPLGYAEEHRRLHYPEKLQRSIGLAQCIIDRADQPKIPPELAWIGEFGTMFVDPDKVAADTSACHQHLTYMATRGRSYCPASTSTQGVCSSYPPTGANKCGGGQLSAVQHYKLSSEKTDDRIRNIDAEIKTFLSLCRSAGP
jgi:hypothetical protein